jgi:hypothetical protein
MARQDRNAFVKEVMDAAEEADGAAAAALEVRIGASAMARKKMRRKDKKDGEDEATCKQGAQPTKDVGEQPAAYSNPLLRNRSSELHFVRFLHSQSAARQRNSSCQRTRLGHPHDEAGRTGHRCNTRTGGPTGAEASAPTGGGSKASPLVYEAQMRAV